VTSFTEDKNKEENHRENLEDEEGQEMNKISTSKEDKRS